jgi:AraC family transcriptional regulator
MRLAGFIYKTSTRYGEYFGDVPRFWQDYAENGNREKLQRAAFVKPGVEYGVTFTPAVGTGHIEYLIGMELKERAVCSGFEVRDVPAALYAIFSNPPVDSVRLLGAFQDTWAFIAGEWLPNSGYFINHSAFDFERYDKRAGGKTGRVCDIYVPVMKKNEKIAS